ncbi:MAG: septum formation inhibitor Maf, partial [Bacteroidales bacterium]|nr:septum formation inhibitor Maf [Bacteroidales bacterium]
SKVRFKKLRTEEIQFYIKTYKPFDKAGAYGIQEWIGLVGITRIEGSYTNIMGLPVQELYEAIIRF